MNSEEPYEDTHFIYCLINSIRPCVYKQGLYALPLFPDECSCHLSSNHLDAKGILQSATARQNATRIDAVANLLGVPGRGSHRSPRPHPADSRDGKRNVPEQSRAWPPIFTGSAAEFESVDRLPGVLFASGRTFGCTVVSGRGP